MLVRIIYNPIIYEIIIGISAVVSVIAGAFLNALATEYVHQKYKDKKSKKSSLKSGSEMSQLHTHRKPVIIALLVVFGILNVSGVGFRENIAKKMVYERYIQYREDMVNAVNNKDLSLVTHNFMDKNCQIYALTESYISELKEGVITDSTEVAISNRLENYEFHNSAKLCTAVGYEITSVTHYGRDKEVIETIECDEAYEYTFELTEDYKWLLVRQEIKYQR